MISARDHGSLRPFLLPRERVLWSGRPRPFGILYRATDLWLIPFILLFLIVDLWILPSRDASLAAILARREVEIAVAGLGICRFFFDAWTRSRLLYAVTNRRVVVLRTGRRPKVKSVEIGDLPLFEYEEHRGGLGTLRFDFETAPWLAWLGRWRSSERATEMCFEMIDQSRSVYDLIQRETDRWRQERYGELCGPRGFVG